MEARDLLRATVADFFEVDLDQLSSAFPLTGRLGQGSIARAALDSAIRRRVGLKSTAVYSVSTYGELEAALLPDVAGGPPHLSPAPAEAPVPPAAGDMNRILLPVSGAQLSCGVDIELVENLPPATDYWEHEFYTTIFTPKEIAYCLMQASPALHFAGRWCVKEALKKCDHDLLSEEMRNIEFVSDGSRAPYLCHYVNGEARRLPHAVSMAHTQHAAIAVVVKLNGPVPSEAQVPEAPPVVPAATSSQPLDTSRSPHGTLGVLSGLVSLIALGLAILALLRTFRS